MKNAGLGCDHIDSSSERFSLPSHSHLLALIHNRFVSICILTDVIDGWEFFPRMDTRRVYVCDYAATTRAINRLSDWFLKLFHEISEALTLTANYLSFFATFFNAIYILDLNWHESVPFYWFFFFSHLFSMRARIKIIKEKFLRVAIILCYFVWSL